MLAAPLKLWEPLYLDLHAGVESLCTCPELECALTVSVVKSTFNKLDEVKAGMLITFTSHVKFGGFVNT